METWESRRLRGTINGQERPAKGGGEVGGGGSGTSNRHRSGPRTDAGRDRTRERGWTNDEREVDIRQVNSEIHDGGDGMIASKGREHGVRMPERMAAGRGVWRVRFASFAILLFWLTWAATMQWDLQWIAVDAPWPRPEPDRRPLLPGCD